jgi:hypothetical protein
MLLIVMRTTWQELAVVLTILTVIETVIEIGTMIAGADQSQTWISTVIETEIGTEILMSEVVTGTTIDIVIAREAGVVTPTEISTVSAIEIATMTYRVVEIGTEIEIEIECAMMTTTSSEDSVTENAIVTVTAI